MPTNKILFDFEYPFILLGVLTTSKDFSLAWHINRTFEMELVRLDDIQIPQKNGNLVFFSYFQGLCDFSLLGLVQNKSQAIKSIYVYYLLPELKDYDYFVVLFGNLCYHWTDMLQKLRRIPKVHFIQKIDLDKVKHKEVLLALEEYSLMEH